MNTDLTKFTHNLTNLIDVIDENSKLVSEATGIAKNILAKDPNALDNTILEHIIKSHFGESMYDRIRKTYNGLIGT